MSVTDACKHLGGAVKVVATDPGSRCRYRNPLWPNIAEAITRLADHLIAHPGPIDYQRRRQLCYGGLLPPDVWAQICDRTDLGPTEANRSRQLVRSWMFERISGQPTDMSGFTKGVHRPHRQRDDLVERFTPEVIRTLDGEATRFLRDHNVFDEPVQWSPPMNIISDLELPGPDLAAVSISELHRVLGVESVTSPPPHGTSACRPRAFDCCSNGSPSNDLPVDPNPAATTPSAPHTSGSLPPASA